MKTHTFSDWFITAEIIIIGLAEAAHLAGVFLNWPFFRCTVLFWGLTGAGLAAGIVFLLMGRRQKRKTGSKNNDNSIVLMKSWKSAGKAEFFLYMIFALIMLSQLIFICMGNTVYRDSDMTAETVGSFLAMDGIYRVNPMTGFPYEAGIPTRLKILCLPTLYGILCKTTGLEPVTVLRLVIPVVTLTGCYAAFASLGGCLFPRNRKGQACFLAVTALLLWTGAYRYGMDGFNVLFCGWRGVTIRNAVLVPWVLSLCIRKKWFCAFLCVLAEGCIVWTLYGFGVCTAVIAGMTGAGICCRVFSGKENTK